jgi:hypothetical protein
MRCFELLRGPREARRSRLYRNPLRAACQIGGSDTTEPPIAGVWSGRKPDNALLVVLHGYPGE